MYNGKIILHRLPNVSYSLPEDEEWLMTIMPGRGIFLMG